MEQGPPELRRLGRKKTKPKAPEFVKRRSTKKILALFIDGTGLDRATRRLQKRVDMAALIRGVTSGVAPAVARYYTILPFEDDSRHHAFLDAVERAGLKVIVKRLPPKGVSRQVAVDPEMAADIVAFALGHTAFSNLAAYKEALEPSQEVSVDDQEAQRIVVVVCPGKDLAYPISLAKEFGVDTITADFGQFNRDDILKSAAKWLDLSDSETIWKE